MRLRTIFLFIAIFGSLLVTAQTQNSGQDSLINNLVLPKGYVTSEYGSVPEYIKAGKGKQTMILIPGYGFDASVFKDFMEANKRSYTMYTITIPGFGNTTAPPMPDTSISYGLQSWNRGTIEGIVKLIQKYNLQKPIVVGHFVQGSQLAIRMAIDYPDLVGAVIILGGPARFVGFNQGKVIEPPLKDLINYTDKFTGPKWFKHMKKAFFDSANFAPEVYSLDVKRGTALRQQVAEVPMPVIVRYSCEYFASDVKSEFDKIKCPVLVLRATFNRTFLDNPVNGFIKPQFIDTWNDASTRNPLITVKDIEDAACFLWKDKPEEVYREIKNFALTIK
ncbi:MAG: alpha/beta hydrolase [Sphingobacteriales bacterium]|nr:alpha/beta hydrolase [Sphingobacteriales bacterium]